MVRKEIVMKDMNRNEFARFTKRIEKSIRGFKKVRYGYHDRESRTLMLEFVDKQTADTVMSSVSEIIKQYGHQVIDAPTD